MPGCFDVYRLEDLMLRVVPELRDVPLYLKKSSELPSRYRREMYGFTHADLDLTIREHVRWLGRGVGIIIDDLEIRRRTQERHWAVKFIGTGLHELAHHLPFKLKSHSDETGPAARQQLVATLAAETPRAHPVERVAREHIARPASFGGIEFVQHDRAFFRAAAHLLFRTLNQGVRLWPGYIDERLDAFLPDLQEEVVALRNSTFEQISRTPIPEAYRRAWRNWCLVWIVEYQAQAYEDDPTLVDVLEELTTRN